ncbi:hypothetical protein AAG906_019751 [Vitis piasezkii]
MLEYEMRYVMIERLCLALVWATRRLRHYMTEYSVHLISRLDPLRYLFDRPALTRSIVADHLASLPTSEDRPVDDDFPDEEFVAITTYRDGASSSVDIPIDVVVRLLLIEMRSAPAYCCLIGETEVQDDLPWYHDIYQFLRSGTYPEVATTKDRRALRNLATRFVIYRASTDRVMREVHAGVCGPHMEGHMLAQLQAMTSPWPFSVWGIDIIGKVSPKSSSGHESSAYRLQTNGAVEAANKNIKRILRKMVETSRDWLEKLPFALWAYRTSFRTSTGATPYSLVYGMEAVLPVETEMGSLRVA